MAHPAKLPYPAIGIDLGTTYSCAAVYDKGKVHTIVNDQGNRTTPSFVAFNQHEVLIGDVAKNQITINPTNTVFGVKRIIGRKYTDQTVQQDIKQWPFEVICEEGFPKIVVEYKCTAKKLRPEEISALVLMKIKESADAFLGVPVKDVVIACPAYFNDAQRTATKNAGGIAGLNVLRVINEPTAAALAYGFDVGLEGEKNILVFDLGGGTFDVTVLNLSEGPIFEVKATAGDTHLGGEDFDSRMAEHFACLFESRYGKDMRGNPKAVRRLLKACERAKRTLSSAVNASIELDALHEGIDFYAEINRQCFEDLNADLFDLTLQPVKRALADAKLKPAQINEIIMVGGSSRIPRIRQNLQKFFGQKKLNQSINPEEAIAYGAAIQAAILNGTKDDRVLRDLLLLDVIPMSVGVETAGEFMTILIDRNTTIPVTTTRIFTTCTDNQSVVTIKVYQGDNPLTKDNTLLGIFKLRDIPPARKGVPQIDVKFDIDASGILDVTATDRTTGHMEKISILNDGRGNLIKTNVKDMHRLLEEADSDDFMTTASLHSFTHSDSYDVTIKCKFNK